MVDEFRYQALCRANGNLDTYELNRQARLFGIETENKQKRTLCKEIAEAVEAYIAKSVTPCKNGEDSDLTLDRMIKDLPSYLRWSRTTPKGDVYCFSLIDMKRSIDNNIKKDPIGYTITPEDKVDIKEKYDLAESILTPFGLGISTPIDARAMQWLDTVRSNICFNKYIKNQATRNGLTHKLLLRFLVALVQIYRSDLETGEYETRTNVMKTICSFTEGLPISIVKYFFSIMSSAQPDIDVATIYILLARFLHQQPPWSQPKFAPEDDPYPLEMNSRVRQLIDDPRYERDITHIGEERSRLRQYELQRQQNGERAVTDAEGRQVQEDPQRQLQLRLIESRLAEVRQNMEAERQRRAASRQRIRNPHTHRCVLIGSQTYKDLVRRYGLNVVEQYEVC